MHLFFSMMTFSIILLAFVPSASADEEKLPPGLYAVLETTLGNITIELFPKEAPKTVENFVGLAEGTKEWVDPMTRKKVKRPLYDGLIFHRVISGFMIQGGDPMRNGMGGPGYQFEDEFSPKLKFDRPGRLAMANAGPNTNGSQFFITEGGTPHLNNHHTIFGQVFKGQEVVRKIARVPKDRRDRPNTDVVIKKVRIIRSK
ncbi:MAG: peptidylprolyl isomerase [Nitrospiria bacterium]